MTRYMLAVGGLSGAVNFLLLAGSNRICGYPPDLKRTVPGAALSAVHSAWCLMPGFYFLGNGIWRTVFLLLSCLVSFGFGRSCVRRATVFLLLSMIFTGVTVEGKGAITAIFGAAGLILVCMIGMNGRGGGCVNVELSHGGKTVSVRALCDTGNTLYDPVTGSPVLVVGADVACELVGLSPWQLKNPVESMGAIPGLRLIPYRTINDPGALMLGMRMKHIRMGNWKGSGLVAFAPERISNHGQYQALTGGIL